MIKAVIFDIDGVLIDSLKANTKFYQNLLIQAGYQKPTDKFLKKSFHMTMKDVIRASINSNNETEVMRIWEMGRTQTQYPYELLSCPLGYQEVIKRLHDSYLLGIVTSRIRGGVFKIPQLAEVKKYFKDIVYFEDTDKHKPDPEPLFLSAQRLGILPQEAVYIGDTQADMVAASSAGMKSIAYSNKKITGANNITSEFVKLPDLINRL